MLVELKDARQIHGEPVRRWFMSPAMDLIIWHDEHMNPIGFQLCYEIIFSGEVVDRRDLGAGAVAAGIADMGISHGVSVGDCNGDGEVAINELITAVNNALGQYAIGGKLGDSIRERQGMAYYISLDTIEYFLDQTQGRVPLSWSDLQAPLNVATELAAATVSPPSAMFTSPAVTVTPNWARAAVVSSFLQAATLPKASSMRLRTFRLWR